MTTARKAVYLVLGWVAAISAAHLLLNVNWAVLLNERLPLDKRRLNVAYIPVT